MDKRHEVKELARMMRRAVDSELPEDEPNDVRDWVYDTCARTALRLLRPDIALVEQHLRPFVPAPTPQQAPPRERRNAMSQDTLTWLAATHTVRLGNAATGRCVVETCHQYGQVGRELLRGRVRVGVVCSQHVIDVRAAQQ